MSNTDTIIQFRSLNAMIRKDREERADFTRFFVELEGEAPDSATLNRFDDREPAERTWIVEEMRSALAERTSEE